MIENPKIVHEEDEFCSRVANLEVAALGLKDALLCMVSKVDEHSVTLAAAQISVARVCLDASQ